MTIKVTAILALLGLSACYGQDRRTHIEDYYFLYDDDRLENGQLCLGDNGFVKPPSIEAPRQAIEISYENHFLHLCKL